MRLACAGERWPLPLPYRCHGARKLPLLRQANRPAPRPEPRNRPRPRRAQL